MRTKLLMLFSLSVIRCYREQMVGCKSLLDSHSSNLIIQRNFRVLSAVRRPCSDFMDMLQRPTNCRFIIIIIIIIEIENLVNKNTE